MTLWIRIRIQNGNPDPGSGTRGKKMKKKCNLLVDLNYIYNGKV
jgi:hypothetical protein